MPFGRRKKQKQDGNGYGVRKGGALIVAVSFGFEKRYEGGTVDPKPEEAKTREGKHEGGMPWSSYGVNRSGGEDNRKLNWGKKKFLGLGARRANKGWQDDAQLSPNSRGTFMGLEMKKTGTLII